MLFRQVLHEDRSCASYVIGCPSRGVAAVVDPQGDIGTYIDLVGRHGLQITKVMDTHVHADHASATRELAQTTGADLLLGSQAEVDFDFVGIDDGQVIDIGNRRMRAIHTPGHTPEHLCLLVDDWFVLTGDTLFVGDVGRVDLAVDEIDESEVASRAAALHGSLRKLLELDDEVEVYPGHYAGSTCGRGMDGKPSSTIARERRTNEPLAMERDEFIRFQLDNIPPLPPDFHAIKRRNVSTVG